ncbi:hypothetical protein AWB74_04153 [Caballeronia arvi]|uniref:HEAT repeat domain-containing protein n=1 Tax=Caballeronia arvi TaxID=1777135 RepID=A0A158JQC4_9BURK|nr:hypothetical protein [Caballeronia arvi]SAL70693.1 hypothetical protein AWB74_04153 [Caballeronia arvi]
MTNQYSKEELETRLKSDDSDEAIDALMYSCFNVNDPEWIQDKCVQVIRTSNNDDLKGLGITCLGHVARIHAKIDKEKIVPVLTELLEDVSLSGRAQHALDDIETFVK